MIERIHIEPVKKVMTRALDGPENGWLLELFKDRATGKKTKVYMTTTMPGTFKGYHLHRIRAARYVCLKGRMKIITYEWTGQAWSRSEHVLDAEKPERMFIPKNVATGLQTIGGSEAWIVNYPDPAYDPDIKDEQIEYTQEELERGIVK